MIFRIFSAGFRHIPLFLFFFLDLFFILFDHDLPVPRSICFLTSRLFPLDSICRSSRL
jgi:hypothetical protein